MSLMFLLKVSASPFLNLSSLVYLFKINKNIKISFSYIAKRYPDTLFAFINAVHTSWNKLKWQLKGTFCHINFDSTVIYNLNKNSVCMRNFHGKNSACYCSHRLLLLLLLIIPSFSIHRLQNKHRPPPPVSDLEGWGPVNLLQQATGTGCRFPASLFRLFPRRRVTLLSLIRTQ